MFFTKSKKYLLFLFFFAFVIFGFTAIQAAHSQTSEPSELKPYSNDTEKWVWYKLCKGEVADLNRYDGKKLNPRKPEEWKGKENTRLLSPKFLEKIILEKPYSKAIHRKGIDIVGAWIREPLNLSNGFIPFQLVLDNSLFDSYVIVARTKIAGGLSFRGSRFNNRLYIYNLSVESNLSMYNVEFYEVGLYSARIGGQLDMSDSKFIGRLNMRNLEIGGSLFMRKGAKFKNVDIRGARIGATLEMIGSKFNGRLYMDNLEVGGSLFMRRRAEFKDVDIRGARIGGQLDMSDSKFIGRLNMDNLEVEGSLFMRGHAEFNDVILRDAEIGDSLQIFDSKFSNFDLTGTKINGEFNLGRRFEEAPKQGKAPEWKKGAKLILRNTEVGALQDLEESWPDEIELAGFTYTRLGGLGVDPKKTMEYREISWFKKWFDKQKYYRPQPYEQLAKVLRQAGHQDKAKAILYFSKNKEREQASGLYKFNLTLQYILIGYGYNDKIAIYWLIGLIFFGSLMLRITKQTVANSWPDRFFYSLDMLIPIIKLNEFHYTKELFGLTKYYFYIHTILGFVLVSYLVAGLSGITQ